MATKSIKVDELNFEDIKTNLKNFLRAQDQFKDYDFDGSNLAVIINLLSYNTYYNSIYNNLTLNEMFLDSASKRNSVVSISKMLGYTPKSYKSSRANVNIKVTFSDSSIREDNSVFYLPKFTQFSAYYDGATYYFINMTERLADINASTGTYDINDVEIFEGNIVSEKYVASPTTRYIISNSNVDTSTVSVYVTDNVSSGETILYKQSDTILNVDPSSEIYFISEIADGKFEIAFGNGVFGKAIETGNSVRIEYLTTSGSKANNCKSFSISSDTAVLSSNIKITTLKAAYGGSEPENIESIKFNAPRSYFTQNRAVTIEDYKSLILTSYDNVEDVNVWGGEDNVPPIYGKVFLSLKPKTTEFLTNDEKLFIKNSILKPKAVVTVVPEFVDPVYMRVQIDTTLYYDPLKTTLSGNSIAELTKTGIISYCNAQFSLFGSMLRYSKLISQIDLMEKSIKNNITTLKLRREVTPKYNMSAQYKLNIGNPIYSEGVAEESFASTGFYSLDGSTVFYLKDDGVGNIKMVYYSGVQEKTANPNIGTIDYKNGIVTANNVIITELVGDTFEFIFKPQSYDVIAVRNQLLKTSADIVNVRAIADDGKAYTFTSSRS